MQSMRGSVDGVIIARYRKGKFTWTCRISDGFYCATFHNGRQTSQTYFSKDKQEINSLIKQELADGFRRIKT